MIIQLIHPPHPDAIDDRLDVPLGLLYLASTLKKAEHAVSILDLSGNDNPRDWRIGQADLYGITSYVSTMAISRKIAQLCKKRNPRAKIIGGGANFTSLVKSNLYQFIPDEFDSVVIGAGEVAILDLIKDMPKLKYVYEHPLNKNLNKYPNPDYSMVDLTSYSRTINGGKSLSMLTSRGCPYRCSFCSISLSYKTVIYRSPEAVVDEIKGIISKYGIRSFNFQDDTFMVNKKRVYKLLKLLEPLDINFRCHGRAGLDTRDDYLRLRDAGCKIICWGIESGSQIILDKMNKNIKIEDNQNVIRWAKAAGLVDRSFFIVGFPGETERTLDETFSFIRETNPSQYFISSFQPYPGTDVWSHPKKYGITGVSYNFSKYLQVYGKNRGGESNIDTEWASRSEMTLMCENFRKKILLRKQSGRLQEYEKILEEDRK